jgi:NDP-sugar pyrophosphorylase family protein
MNVDISEFIKSFALLFPEWKSETPWSLTQKIPQLLTEKVKRLSAEYHIQGNVAIHRSATVEDHVILKGPVIISANCFIGAHAYLRGGVFLDEKVSVGPGCEIKSSIMFSASALAHFNFVGDSIVGASVNMEAGSVIANHYNEREQKIISALIAGKCHPIGAVKFGALVGDHCKIGANAVLSPGTILTPRSIVKRLELIEQCK